MYPVKMHLQPAGVAEVEHRAISVPQLRAAYAHACRRLAAEEWCNDYTGAEVTEESLNLYDVAGRVIGPATHPYQCAYVELVADWPQRPRWFPTN